MPPKKPDTPPPPRRIDSERYLTPEVTAAYLGLMPKTLQNQRSKGQGPPYIRIGSGVRYPESSLIEWLDKHPRFGGAA